MPALLDREAAPAAQDSEAGTDGWRVMRSLTLARAGDVLDWLEESGVAVRELTVQKGGLFAVRWRV